MPDRYDIWVDQLAVTHRRQAARRALMAGGAEATPALRRGLRHPDPAVRVACCVVLDHHLDEAAVPELVANLDHADEEVRAWALHALACDRCKEGSCRPAEADVVPTAVRMLERDPSARVRVMAVGLLGEVVHRHPEVVGALDRAHRSDPDPMVRKKAGWMVPGGPVFERTRPRPPRRPRPAGRMRTAASE